MHRCRAPRPERVLALLGATEVGRLGVVIAGRPGIFPVNLVADHADEIATMHGVFEALELPLFPWHAAPKHRFVRILADEITGRRFTVLDPAAAQLGPWSRP